MIPWQEFHQVGAKLQVSLPLHSWKGSVSAQQEFPSYYFNSYTPVPHQVEGKSRKSFQKWYFETLMSSLEALHHLKRLIRPAEQLRLFYLLSMFGNSPDTNLGLSKSTLVKDVFRI